MLEISNIQLPLEGLNGSSETLLAAATSIAQRTLRLDKQSFLSVEIRKRSIDARKKSDVRLVVSLRVTLVGGTSAERKLLEREAKRSGRLTIRAVDEKPELLPSRVPMADIHPGQTASTQKASARGSSARSEQSLEDRPLVVGAGAAGLFCALALANAGLSPVLIERGDNATRRSQAVELFNQTGELDPESNIQFGLGGAGTFSDGKLYTGTRASTHRLILETFVEAGADPSILYDAHPHIGSDVLPAVVEHVRSRIESLGGEVRLRTKLTSIEFVNGTVRAATLESTDGLGVKREERFSTTHLILACGHSARDVYELLNEQHVALERKPFAMGVRIEHLQADINLEQYGKFADHPELGAAPYKLVAHAGSRSAFSFCMCPGGYVVAAASEPGGVCTNGMSLSKRDGMNANAGLLVAVDPGDIPGTDVLAGIEVQRRYEQAAFEAGGGAFKAPVQLVGDFLQRVASTGQGAVMPTYPRGTTWTSLDGLLPEHISETLRDALPQLNKKLSGFAAPDAVLTGVETRSSSPVRVVRGDNMQSISHKGLYPIGEGAGYAGGIMSAAADGLRCAHAILA